jgi:hypothetical protein
MVRPEIGCEPGHHSWRVKEILATFIHVVPERPWRFDDPRIINADPQRRHPICPHSFAGLTVVIPDRAVEIGFGSALDSSEYDSVGDHRAISTARSSRVGQARLLAS